jgi:hypothetical protein
LGLLTFWDCWLSFFTNGIFIPIFMILVVSPRYTNLPPTRRACSWWQTNFPQRWV